VSQYIPLYADRQTDGRTDEITIAIEHYIAKMQRSKKLAYRNGKQNMN